MDDCLDAYRPELHRLLWPIFVHSILNLAAEYYPRDCENFYKNYNKAFEREHADDLRLLSVITTPEHLENQVAKLYRGSKYRLTLTKMAYNVLIQFLESKEDDGGDLITSMINNNLNIVEVDRANTGLDRSLAAMMSKRGEEWDTPAEDEGIPGHNPGSANTHEHAPNVLPKLALGPRPLENDLLADLRAELEDEDARHPPEAGESSLLDSFEDKIKKEPTEDGPRSDAVPLPPAVARDVAMEITKVREHRDRFKIDPITGGVAPGISVCMYTFHNTFDRYCSRVFFNVKAMLIMSSITCLDFSGDLMLVAAGTSKSYIQVWSLDGAPLIDRVPGSTEKPASSKRLIGHQDAVYSVSFSPSTTKPNSESVETNPRLLLSASADRTIRMWSVDGWSCLCQFRAHTTPIWDVQWGPYGHYFLSCGMDKVARIWSQEHVSPLRIFVGHDSDVDVGAWHPNGCYVFTAGDKTVRMWDIMRGTAVRMFTGHTGNITALECSPDGKSLASADDQGNIILWDLTTGSRTKRMRGHGKGGVWSLSWSVESSVIVSGGADNSVRVWDASHRGDGKSNAEGPKMDGLMSAPPVPGSALLQKKTKKDIVVTPDQLSVFPTKKSPVYKVMFTRCNLVVAGSAYMPEPA